MSSYQSSKYPESIAMSTITSDNSKIITCSIPNISDKHEENVSDNTESKAMSTVIEKSFGISYKKRQLSIISESSNKSSDKHEENESDDTESKAVSTVIEKNVGISYKKRKLSKIFESYSSKSSKSSSSLSSDSDTDNNYDEDEIERERKLCEEKIQQIQSEFCILKEMLYKERIDRLKTELAEVSSGIANDYSEALQKLKDEMESRLNVASVLKQFKLVNSKHKYESEKQTIKQNFENNKEMLYDTIKADIEEKIEQLEEDRKKVEIDATFWLGRSLRRSGCGRGRCPYGHAQPKRKVAVLTSGPCVVYMLKEHEILDDWTTIKKLLPPSKQRENVD